MTLTPELRKALQDQPGRCRTCCRHVALQGGHADDCINPSVNPRIQSKKARNPR